MKTSNHFQASNVAVLDSTSRLGGFGLSALVVAMATLSLLLWAYCFGIDVSDGYGTQHGWLGVIAKGIVFYFLAAIASIVSLITTAIGWSRVRLPVRVIGVIPSIVLAGCIVWIMVN